MTNKDYINKGIAGSIVATTGLSIVPIAVGVPINTLNEVLFPITLGAVVSIMAGSVIAQKLKLNKKVKETSFDEDLTIQTLKEVMEKDDNEFVTVSKPNVKMDYAHAEIKPFYYDFDNIKKKQK